MTPAPFTEGALVGHWDFGHGCTGPDGTLTVALPREPALPVFVRCTGYIRSFVNIEPAIHEAGRLTMRIRRSTQAITGRIANYVTDSLDVVWLTAQPLYPIGDGKTPLYWREYAEPDPDGNFTIPCPDTGLHELMIISCGRNQIKDTVRAGTDIGAITIDVPSQLQAQVVDADTREPLTAFTARNIQTGSRSEVEDPKGLLSVLSERQGVNPYVIRAEGYLPRLAVLHTDSTSPEPPVVPMERSAVVDVEVRHGSERVNDAELTLYRGHIYYPEFLRRARTDSTGHGRIDEIEPGNYKLMVERKPYAPMMLEVSVDDRRELTVTMGTGGVIAGTIVNADGSGLTGRRLSVKQDPRFGPEFERNPLEVPVDSGTFGFTGLIPGMYTLFVLMPWSAEHSYLPLFRLDSLVTGSEDLQIELPPQRDWLIKAFHRGKPVTESLSIGIIMPPVDDSLGTSAMRYLRVPATQGAMHDTYTVHTYVGMRFVAEIVSDNYERAFKEVVIPPGAGPYETRIDLHQAPLFRARVVHFDSLAPVENQAFFVDDAARARTDTAGVLVVTGVPARQFAVEGGRDPYLALHVPTNGTKDAVIRLAPPGVVRGTIAGVKGIAPALRRVELLRPLLEHATVRETAIGGDGTFVFDGVAPGRYVVRTLDGRCAQVVSVEPGAEAAVSLAVPATPCTPSVTIQGIPSGATGDAWLQSGTQVVYARSGRGQPDQGRFDFGSIGAGNWVLQARYTTIEPSECLLWSQPFAAVKGRPRVTARVAPRRLTVQCVGPEGRSAPGVMVYVRPVTARKGSSVPAPVVHDAPWRTFSVCQPTDGSGRVTAAGLSKGTYCVTLSHPLWGAVPRTVVLAAAADTVVKIALTGATPVDLAARYRDFHVRDFEAIVWDSAGRPLAAVSGDALGVEREAVPAALVPGTYLVGVCAPFMAMRIDTVVVGTRRLAHRVELTPCGWAEIGGATGSPADLVLTPPKGQPFGLASRCSRYLPEARGKGFSSLFVGNLAPGKYRLSSAAGGPDAEMVVAAGRLASVTVK